MKALILLLALLGSGFSPLAKAGDPPSQRPTLYFLSSIDPATLKGALFHHWGHYQHYIEGLASQFESHFNDSGYAMIIRQNADRAELFKALHDPSAVGVFWVSHSNPFYGRLRTGGVDFPPEILDASGSDVKDVFKQIHPNLRWLSVISCDSDQVLKFEKMEPPPSTRIQGFDKVVNTRKALQEALDQSNEVLSSPAVTQGYEEKCVHQRGRQIKIFRTLRLSQELPKNYVFPAVTIQYRGKDIAAFQAVKASRVQQSRYGALTRSQTLWIEMPERLKESNELTLIVNSGLGSANVAKNFDLGDFKALGSWPGSYWKTFSDLKTRKPFGVTENILLYRGTLSPSTPLQRFTPFDCAPVSAVRNE